MDRGFLYYLNIITRAISAVAAIKTLIVLAVASGAAVTIVALWQQVPWYMAVTCGCLIFAALVMSIVGLDQLYRVHGIKGKITLRELRVRDISFNEATKKLDVRIGVYIINKSTRTLWIRIDRVQCQLDLQTHEPYPAGGQPYEMEVQRDNAGGIATDRISLDPTKREFLGTLEVDAQYGKKKGKYLRGPYKTKGKITLVVANSPLGWNGYLMAVGGEASYD